MSIKPLPGDVVAQIKSSVVITSLNSVARGLVENALDAGASKINVSLDYARGGCTVEDNGVGIPPPDFRADGGLGKLHYTSRYPPRDDMHGRHGTFLASLSALSLLSVASHHREYESHNSMAIHNSRVAARNLPALPDQRFLAFPSGTRVTVHDLFGSMPVRVKQRARETERHGSTRDFGQLTSDMVALLIMWPAEVTISLRDTSTKKVVYLRAPAPMDISGGNESADLLLRAPKLLTQASLCDAEDFASWVAIGASAPGLNIRGCVSLTPVATKRIQFIAIGIQPLLNEHRSNVLFEELNRVFANSSFGLVERERDNDGGEDDNNGTLGRTEDLATKNPKPKKGIDRWPMFCLQISLDSLESIPGNDMNELLNERHRSFTTMTQLLRVMAYEFLKKHHFQPRHVDAFHELQASADSSARQTSETSGWDITPSSQIRKPKVLRLGSTKPRSSSKPRSLRSSSIARQSPSEAHRKADTPFALWSRVKSSGPIRPVHKDSSTRDYAASQSEASENHNGKEDCSTPRWIDKTGKLLRKPFDDTMTLQSLELPRDNAQEDTATASVADGRAEGSMTKVQSEVGAGPSSVEPGGSGALEKRISLRRPKHDVQAVGPPTAPWLREILSTWKNPVFEPSELPIERVVDVSESLTLEGTSGYGGCQGGSSLTFGGSGAASSMAMQGKISRQALKMAKIIAQVEAKFILVKIPRDAELASTPAGEQEGDLMVLIDQHAADERCRVEELIQSYFVLGQGEWRAQTESLSKPLRFDLPKQEGELLVRFQAHFEHWGIFYEVFAPDNRDKQRAKRSVVKVDIQGLPPSILERCRLEPRLIADLLRKEMWKLHDDPNGAIGNGGHGEAEQDWVSRFHGCPQGILDLINSRSCRSAIMFNDHLSAEDCESLVQRLTRCSFPFQCAHGRPSMVPLLDLGRDVKTNPRFDPPASSGDFRKKLSTWVAARKASAAPPSSLAP